MALNLTEAAFCKNTSDLTIRNAIRDEVLPGRLVKIPGRKTERWEVEEADLNGWAFWGSSRNWVEGGYYYRSLSNTRRAFLQVWRDNRGHLPAPVFTLLSAEQLRQKGSGWELKSCPDCGDCEGLNATDNAARTNPRVNCPCGRVISGPSLWMAVLAWNDPECRNRPPVSTAQRR